MVIPELNIPALRERYPAITQCYSDDTLREIYSDQVLVLGVRTYKTAGYLKDCRSKDCTEENNYNYQLLKLATLHQLCLEQRGGAGSPFLTGQSNFSSSYGVKSGFATDLDEGYNGSAYGTPDWNLTLYGKQILTIVQKDVQRVYYTTDSTSQCSGMR